MCDIKMGDYARDKVSGLEGQVLGIAHYLYEETAIWLHPINQRDSSGKWLPMIRCEKKEPKSEMGLH